MDDTIRIRDLKIHFPLDGKTIRAVDTVTATFRQDEVTGVIGETGCGKSVLGLSLLNLLPSEALISGDILMGETDVRSLTGRRLREYRNSRLSLIPQNPSTSLNPIMRVGKQMGEAYNAVGKKGDPLCKMRSFLHPLGFNSQNRMERKYPFELSGGMRERILVAIGLVRDPAWLLADEPTKGLDVSLRDTVSSLLADIIKNRGGVILITHDIVLAEKLCDRLLVMYGGHILEEGRGEDVLNQPAHPYTKGLIRALPKNGFETLDGPPIGISSLPGGCRFHPRCPHQTERCTQEEPGLYPWKTGRRVRCFLYAEG